MTAQDHSKTKIKICGLRRREDILTVNEAKPDYCGFIVEFPRSFRSVTADQVRELVKELAPEIQPVGVFVNAPMELVRSLLDDEDPAGCGYRQEIIRGGYKCQKEDLEYMEGSTFRRH